MKTNLVITRSLFFALVLSLVMGCASENKRTGIGAGVQEIHPRRLRRTGKPWLIHHPRRHRRRRYRRLQPRDMGSDARRSGGRLAGRVRAGQSGIRRQAQQGSDL